MLKTRKELMIVDNNHGGYLAGHCALCGDPGWIGKIAHKLDCLLRDPGVTHVRMTAIRAAVVIRGPRTTDGRYWWTSSNTGQTYDIGRQSQSKYFIMHRRGANGSGEVIVDNARLRDIRKYIVDNQGRL